MIFPLVINIFIDTVGRLRRILCSSLYLHRYTSQEQCNAYDNMRMHYAFIVHARRVHITYNGRLKMVLYIAEASGAGKGRHWKVQIVYLGSACSEAEWIYVLGL